MCKDVVTGKGCVGYTQWKMETPDYYLSFIWEKAIQADAARNTGDYTQDVV